jgi:hypothetical protein
VSLWSEKWGGVVFYMSHAGGEMGGLGVVTFKICKSCFNICKNAFRGIFLFGGLAENSYLCELKD